MLGTLIKKQLLECFRNYFVSRKTNKPNSKGKIIGTFIGFGILMMIMAGIMLSFAVGIHFVLEQMGEGMQWVYFAAMGGFSILFGIFGSVFNTYSSLYLPKDNESLLAMPIKPGHILLSRLVMVYLLSLMYSGIVWLPSVLFAILIGSTTPLGAVFGILLLFVIALFVTVITCVLGWVVALIATRIRSKGIITAVLAVGFFALYYYVCFNLSSIFDTLAENLAAIGDAVQKYVGLLYALGQAGAGQGNGMLIFTGVTVGMTALCLLLMERTYMRMLLKKPHEKKKNTAVRHEGQHGVYQALLTRELKRFTSNATYLMNAGFGIILMILGAAALLFLGSGIIGQINQAKAQIPELGQLIPYIAPHVIGLIVSLNCISLPSVSLEGKNIWILQTMPVSPRKILQSKRDLHVILNLVPAAILLVIFDVMLQLPALNIIAGLLFTTAFCFFTADMGLIQGIRHADLKWTSETVLIKSNMQVFVILLLGLAVTLVHLAAGFLLSAWIPSYAVTGIVTLLLCGVVFLQEKWLRTKGCERFSHLG